MPIGPSHGSRSGGFSRGSVGGSRKSSGGSGIGSLVGHVLGAALLTSAVRRRRNRYYAGDDGGDNNSMPRRKKPTLFLILAIITAVIAVFTMVFRSSNVSSSKEIQNRITIMETDWIEYEDLIEKATEGGHDGYYTTTAYFSTIFFSLMPHNSK